MSLHIPTVRRTTCVSLVAVCALLAGGCRAVNCADGLIVLDERCAEPPEGGTCGGCSEHELCDTGVTPNTCTCVPGYAGEPCAFDALIRDPGFRQVIDIPGELGDLDPGEGDLDDSVLCNGASLLQVVDMPSYPRADPFVVEINYKAEGVHGLAVGFDRSWTRLPATGPDWQPARFCVGEGGYGRDPGGNEVEVRIAASERLANCYDPNPGSIIRVDHFRIIQAEDGECLAPGSVRNGTVEPGGEVWQVLTEQEAEGGFAPGEGQDATTGVRITRGAGQTGRATMATQVSVPLAASLVSPALVFWWRGSSGDLFNVELGTLIDLDDRGRQLDTLAGTGSGLPYIYCLPPWTHGSELDVSFSLPDDGVGSVELVVDDVRITSDPDCGTEPDLLDPGFESAPNRWLGASVGSSQETVVLQENNQLARSGKGLLEFTYEREGATLAMETYVFVPPSDGDEGPALTFHSLSPATASADVKWLLGQSEVETGDVLTEVSWQPNEVCLPPHWSSRWFRVQVRVVSTPGVTVQERILLDDFSLGTSASCPIE